MKVYHCSSLIHMAFVSLLLLHKAAQSCLFDFFNNFLFQFPPALNFAVLFFLHLHCLLVSNARGWYKSTSEKGIL